MEKKILIIGHGIAGCVLALTLFRRGIPFTISGIQIPGESSMASSGLINPITGRRYVKAWMIDDLIEKSIDFYTWTENLLSGTYFFPVDIVRFLSNDEARDAWKKRIDDPEYVTYISKKRFSELDQLKTPYGIVTGGYRLDTPSWLTAARNFLLDKKLLRLQFEPIIEDVVETGQIIFATGAATNVYSNGIIPNKGEVLIVKLPGWKLPGIVKEKVYFIPLKEKEMFWVGSYYQPWPGDPNPSEEGRTNLIEAISEFYTGEIEVIEHLSGVRPTVDDRRPLIGSIPGYPNKFLFNGMGTKGTSLAPYWSEQLLSHIFDTKPLPSIVNPARYSVIPG